MSRGRASWVLLCAFALLCAAPAAPGGAAPATFADVAAAEQRAEELADEVATLEADQRMLETRVDVTNQRLAQQREVVDQAEGDLAAAREAFRTKLVAMYKSRGPDPISLLLGSESIGDLLSRALLLSRIAQSDGEVLRDAAVAADEAAYQVAVLDDLKAQDVALREIQEAKGRRVKEALAEQRQLIERLTAEAKRALEEKLEAERRATDRWRESSVPLDSTINFVDATVQPYTGTWLVPDFRPRTYKSTGEIMTARCSWYGNEFHGRKTASGQIFNENDFTCASNWHPFGTYLALSRGSRRIIVVVNDRGPFVWNGSGWSPHPVRKLDLSKASAYALGFTGTADVTIERVTALP